MDEWADEHGNVALISYGPWDVMHAGEHPERNDVGYCGGFTFWERMISRLQLYGSVTKDLPASMYQLTKGTIYVSEDLARSIEPTDLVVI